MTTQSTQSLDRERALFVLEAQVKLASDRWNDAIAEKYQAIALETKAQNEWRILYDELQQLKNQTQPDETH